MKFFKTWRGKTSSDAGRPAYFPFHAETKSRDRYGVWMDAILWCVLLCNGGLCWRSGRRFGTWEKLRESESCTELRERPGGFAFAWGSQREGERKGRVSVFCGYRGVFYGYVVRERICREERPAGREARAKPGAFHRSDEDAPFTETGAAGCCGRPCLQRGLSGALRYAKRNGYRRAVRLRGRRPGVGEKYSGLQRVGTRSSEARNGT